MEIKEGVAVAKTISVDDLKMATPCLICNESIEIDKYASNGPVLVCQKCKGAILYMRNKLDKEGINYVNYIHDNM